MKKFLSILASIGFVLLALFVNLAATFVAMISMSKGFISEHLYDDDLSKQLLNWLLKNDRAMIITIIGTSAVMLVFGLWYFFGFRKMYKTKAKQVYTIKSIPAILLMGLLLQVGIDIVITFVLPLFENIMKDYNELMSSFNSESTWVTLVATAICAPIAEESVFRGVMFRTLRKNFPFWAANLIQAFLFGVYHLNIVQFVYAFAIGAIFGMIAERTKRLIPSMLLHASINGSALLVEYILTEQVSSSTWALVAIMVGTLLAALGLSFLVPTVEYELNPKFDRSQRVDANEYPIPDIRYHNGPVPHGLANHPQAPTYVFGEDVTVFHEE